MHLVEHIDHSEDPFYENFILLDWSYETLEEMTKKNPNLRIFQGFSGVNRNIIMIEQLTPDRKILLLLQSKTTDKIYAEKPQDMDLLDELLNHPLDFY